MSRPRFARRVRGRRALTLAFAPRLIIQPSGACQIFQQNPPINPRPSCRLLDSRETAHRAVRENHGIGPEYVPRVPTGRESLQLTMDSPGLDWAWD